MFLQSPDFKNQSEQKAEGCFWEAAMTVYKAISASAIQGQRCIHMLHCFSVGIASSGMTAVDMAKLRPRSRNPLKG